MSTYKFLHAADLHIDSPLRGLDKYDGAPVDEIRGASRRALENLVNLAIEERVAFVLLAGDIYDGKWPDHNTGLYFVSQMAELNTAGIKVYIVSGNHDAESKITKQLNFPDNVTQFPANKPKTVRVDDLEYSVHGQSFAEGSVSENLAANYPAPTPNHINIGLLHTSVDGREGHANYAPCTLRDLKDKGYDYWALGHIHKREVLSEDPYVVFPGNIQGRHAREMGEKGCTLVSVDDGKITNVEHRNLDVLRWLTCEIDASDFDATQEILDSLGMSLKMAVQKNGNTTLAARVIISGSTNTHYKLIIDKDDFTNDCRAQAMAISGADIWIEKVIFKTSAKINAGNCAVDKEALSSIQKRISRMLSNSEMLDTFIKEFSELNKRLPEEAKTTDDGKALIDKESIMELLKDAGDLVTGNLAGGQS